MILREKRDKSVSSASNHCCSDIIFHVTCIFPSTIWSLVTSEKIVILSQFL